MKSSMQKTDHATRAKKAVIIGAGPAGLTAAYELLKLGTHSVVILEATDRVGGISCTVNYKGNRLDMGGHRFFSKSEAVMRWWAEMLPIAHADTAGTELRYQGAAAILPPFLPTTSPDDPQCLLIRPRRSRIFFLKTFFDYPLRLSMATLQKLGFSRVIQAGVTYVLARLRPRQPEQTLEDFLINRFGSTLYRLFFESYTKKVWGRPCSSISAEWGAQRIKGLSIAKAIMQALKRPFAGRQQLTQKSTETSLIESFLYPRFGPGQMWETCLGRIIAMGGQIFQPARVTRINREGSRITSVAYRDASGVETVIEGDVFFSTMPIQDLVAAMSPLPPARMCEIAHNLPYRSFITIGMLVEEMKVFEEGENGRMRIKDNWIYIQDPGVKMGRLQIFNNWSPGMVANDAGTTWLGLEYFCDEGDDLWETSDQGLIELGLHELEQIGLVEKSRFLDATVCRVPKAYPAYFGGYEQFPELRAWLDTIENLFLIGRNGMHRYNNQDHSMLSAMYAVKLACGLANDRAGLWNINAEAEYHEEK